MDVDDHDNCQNNITPPHPHTHTLQWTGAAKKCKDSINLCRVCKNYQIKRTAKQHLALENCLKPAANSDDVHVRTYMYLYWMSFFINIWLLTGQYMYVTPIMV